MQGKIEIQATDNYDRDLLNKINAARSKNDSAIEWIPPLVSAKDWKDRKHLSYEERQEEDRQYWIDFKSRWTDWVHGIVFTPKEIKVCTGGCGSGDNGTNSGCDCYPIGGYEVSWPVHH